MMALQTRTNTYQPPRIRVVGLNAISPSMFIPVGLYTFRVMPTEDINELRKIFDRYTLEKMIPLENITWIHFIRHKPTLDVLRMVFPQFPEQPAGMVYKYAPGDLLIIATLKHGSRGTDKDVVVDADDLIYWFVTVRHASGSLTLGNRKYNTLTEELLR